MFRAGGDQPAGERSKNRPRAQQYMESAPPDRRGGMGEVYEGVETNTGDPVASIPALAAYADPKVKELFLSEARNFVRLSKAHPALVQYRVCAEEPQLRESSSSWSSSTANPCRTR